MTIRSDIGQVGDEVTLFSPRQTFDYATLLAFTYHMLISDEDTAAALTVHTYSPYGVYEQRLLEIRGSRESGWHTASVCLPKGTYQLAFVATHGLQFLSDIALNRVELQHYEDCISLDTGKYGESVRRKNTLFYFHMHLCQMSTKLGKNSAKS